MEQVIHRLECGHLLQEPKGNAAGFRREAFCTPCRSHVSILETIEKEVAPESQIKDIHVVPGTTEVIDISQDETPEIHSEEADDDAPL